MRSAPAEPIEGAPEPDRVAGAPHPRQTGRLFGQAVAERAFLSAWEAGRVHHAWLIRGPHGVGKATLAYRIARAVLSATSDAAPASLDVPFDHPVSRRMASGSEPRLRALVRPLRRKPGSRDIEKPPRLAAEIPVDDVRALRDFFQLSAADGGWRALVVDAADDLNPQAANAFLKLLEEPPARTLMLLVSHMPGRLLPTIRSRCRTLDCAPLAPADFAAALAQAGGETAQAGPLAELAGGAPGAALALAAEDGAALYADLARLAAQAPGVDRRALRALAASCAGRDAAPRAALAVRLGVTLLQRLARSGVASPSAEAAPGEAALARRLAPDLARARFWAETAAELDARATRALAVNLDPEQTILDMWLRIDAAAARARAASQGRAPASSPT